MKDSLQQPFGFRREGVMQIEQITERISYIKASNEPLSADVGIIEGDQFFYVFDVGNTKEAAVYLQTLLKEKQIIVSHFHPDHIGNLTQLTYKTLYLGANTAKYVAKQLDKETVEEIPGCYVVEETDRMDTGNIQAHARQIHDGVELCITQIPSSHAKGCLALTVDKTYTFLGDATYCTSKRGVAVYNVQLLKEQLDVLSALETSYFLLSHAKNFVQKKETVLDELAQIYDRRKKGIPYIEVTELDK